MTTPTTKRRVWPWWTAMAVLAGIFAAYSLVVGQFLVGTRQPVELGHSGVGEWADLSEYGFKVRFEGLEFHDSMPSEWDQTRLEYPPQGMQFLQARFTVELLVDPDADVGCEFNLFNADGEELDLTGIGLAGAEGTGCRYTKEDGAVAAGDTFTSHQVFVVQQAPVEGFTVRVDPLFSDEQVYWTVSY